MIRIVLADDHEVVRSGFKMILNREPDMSVVGEAMEGTQAYALVAREKPDVILLDISMSPGQNGLVACERISHDFPETAVVMLTMFVDPEYLRYSMQHGAKGYLVKSATPSELCDAIRCVIDGRIYIHPAVAELVKNGTVDSSRPPIDVLSARELEIMQLLALGYTNKQISEKVFLSIKTIEAHRAKIYTKLNFENRADLVEYALQHHLMQL